MKPGPACRIAEGVAKAAVDVAAALQIAVPVAGDRIERDRAEIIFDRAGDVLGLELLEIEAVGAHFVALEIAAVDADQLVAAPLERIGAEDARVAVEVAELAGQAERQRVGRLELDLGAQGDVVIAFEVVARRTRRDCRSSRCGAATGPTREPRLCR